jgi:N-acyl-D-aspartate/D-glutamate deacylase
VLDLVIRGGRVVDGTGTAARTADVGIQDGRIIAVGRIVDGASRTIKADGLIVAPGFIDVHTHFDVQGFWDPLLSPSPLHGVTTVIGGNCGFSVAPLDASAAPYLMRMLARVEGMPLRSLEVAVPWDWRSTAEFLNRYQALQPAINVGFMVGHSALRRVVMGEDAVRRESSPEELAAMQELLRSGLRAGGFGFSSTRSPRHRCALGIVMTRLPGAFARYKCGFDRTECSVSWPWVRHRQHSESCWSRLSGFAPCRQPSGAQVLMSCDEGSRSFTDHNRRRRRASANDLWHDRGINHPEAS